MTNVKRVLLSIFIFSVTIFVQCQGFSKGSSGIYGECKALFRKPIDVTSPASAVKWNLFSIGSTLYDYIQYFYRDFKKSLENLTNKDSWLDLGAGKGIAAEQFLSSIQATKSIEEAPQVIVLSYRLGRWFPLPKFGGKLRAISKVLWEDLPIESFPKQKLITDFFGVLSYSKQLSLALSKIFSVLSVGGEFYLRVRNDTIFIDTESGPPLSLTTFIRQIPGLKVEGEHGVLKITKLVEQIEVPNLELIQIDERQRPFQLRFRLIGAAPP